MYTHFPSNDPDLSLKRFDSDFINLELRLSLATKQCTYKILEEHISERMDILKTLYPNAKLLNEYKALYRHWKQQRDSTNGEACSCCDHCCLLH